MSMHSVGRYEHAPQSSYLTIYGVAVTTIFDLLISNHLRPQLH